MTDLETARASLARLYDKLEAAMEGRGKAPDPAVIEAAEKAVRLAEFKLEREAEKA